nr:hypothetical protein [Spirochaetaceae bacterium]
SLAWNYDEPATIQSYKLYYKANEDIEWILLDTIPATVPIFEVEHATIGDGSWDFGVSSVDLLGNESEIHSSLDFNADPTTGWYLLWVN